MDDVFKGFTEDIFDPSYLNGLRAAIDIGTNTVLLLVAQVDDGKINSIDELQRIPRLGKGVDRTGNLDVDSMNRTISVLIEYRDYIVEKYGVIPVLLTGTSAVRDAKNRIEFLRLIEESTGYRLRILSASEEAKVTFKGALSVLKLDDENEVLDSYREYIVIDIGGGSTELAIGGKDVEPHTQLSMDIGSVRFTERYLKESPPRRESLDIMRIEIRQQLQILATGKHHNASLIGVGVAGTAKVLWHLMNKGNELSCSDRISLTEIDRLIEQLSTMSVNQILELDPIIMKGRADIILAGACILQAVMKTLYLEEISVSNGGVRHGSLLTYIY